VKEPSIHVKLKGVPWKENAGKSDSEPADERLSVGVPLARIVQRTLEQAPELVLLSQPRSVAAEKFRRLKTVLSNVADPGPPQVIVVTSATPGDGKSMVSMNLALAFAADATGDVLLIDADMRRPTLEKWLNPEPTLGLSEVLGGHTTLEHAILDLKNAPLKVLPAGHPPKETAELLSSNRCGEMMAALRKQFRRIVVDTPPIVPFTDADVVASLSDGVVMVVREGATPRPLFLQALASVTSARILGTVLNDAQYNLADRHRHHESYYSRYYDKDRRK
jgi:receptor protein-tyrosine kinase/non-specific protein-tyrosine kinase